MAPFRLGRLGPLALSLLLCLCAASVRAQGGPREGSVSISGAGGFVAPSQGAFDSTFGVSGGIDYFLTPALSVGATAGGWRAGTDLGSHANEFYLDADAAYNWKIGKLAPFVQGGIGAYREDFPARSAATSFGGFAGGGLDFSWTNNWAIEGALRYHLTRSVQGLRGSFFEGLAGVRLSF